MAKKKEIPRIIVPYRGYSRVFGNKVEQVKRESSYISWKEMYLSKNNLYKRDIIVDEVVKGIGIRLNLQQVLEIGEKYRYLGADIKRICMKGYYTGVRVPAKELRKLMVYNIEQGNDNFLIEVIIHMA